MEQETKKKKKSGLRKAMLPALAMLLVSVLSLTTMTYAWFTQGTEATVGEFQLDVAAGGGLEIATAETTDTVWKSSISSEEIVAIDGVKDFVSGGTKKLFPVSTVGEYAEGKIKFFEANIDNSEQHQIESVTAASADHYLTFDLYFRNSSSEDKNISLTGTAFGAVETSSAHLSTRMAFINAGSHKVNAVGSPTYTDDPATDGTAVIFEPNEENHTNDGIHDYEENGKGKVTGSLIEGVNTGKISYFGLKGTYDGNEGHIDRYTAKDNVLAEVTTKAASETFFTLKGSTVTKVTVYIWIEGQDADCTNFISSNVFNAQLKFVATGAGA